MREAKLSSNHSRKQLSFQGKPTPVKLTNSHMAKVMSYSIKDASCAKYSAEETVMINGYASITNATEVDIGEEP